VTTVVRQVDAERFEVVLPTGVAVVGLTRASRDALGLRAVGPAAVVAAAVDLLLEHGEAIVVGVAGTTGDTGVAGDTGVEGADVVARLARHPGLLEELRARLG